ncbi:MAG: glycerophosphodiester phosphodiesterase family protein [Arcanobacterium sp.]|nr:glycerophosphodiester phosphodiesterase family protein [Arcanobacterium sp.]
MADFDGASAFKAPKVLGRSTWLSFRLPPFTRNEPTERVIGHRGSAGTMPENTRSSFREAWDHGCRVLETDAQATADGVAVCFHDDDLKRVTGLPGTVADYSYSDLLSKARVHGPHGRSDTILRIEELIEEFPHAQLVIDIKDARVIDPLVHVINTTRAAARICVTHAWDAWLEEIRDRTSPLLQRNLGWETMAALVRAARTGQRPDPAIHVANWAHIAYRDSGKELMSDPDFSQRFIWAAHSLGIGVRVWTVNDFSEAIRLWSEGVDAVFTDVPKQMVRLSQDLQRREHAAKILGL